MKLASILACSIFAVMMLMFASTGANANADIVIQPGFEHSHDTHVNAGETITYFWFADADLHFTISSPTGTTLLNEVSRSDAGSIDATVTGDYTFTWANEGASTANLDFTVNMFDGFEAVEDAAWSFVIIGIIAVVIIVAVVIILLVVLLGGKKKEMQPAVPGTAPFVAQPAGASGICPTCGSAMASDTSFCARCGTRTR
ncbi:MAG: hypothetical protein MUO84_01570 [Thermoplasmata archaeon]|nr:hypothetical protein [Thermoplasmata archaeon]